MRYTCGSCASCGGGAGGGNGKLKFYKTKISITKWKHKGNYFKNIK